MDVMLFALSIGPIGDEFGLNKAQLGSIQMGTLLAAAFGGVVSGILADRYGRVRMLMVSILIYSLFTGLTATAYSPAMLMVWRTLMGLGLGGLWSAGSVLVAETWPAKHRGKAIGLMQSGFSLGYILAAILTWQVMPSWGWRPLFIIGAAPALLLFWIHRRIAEPEVWLKHAATKRGLLHALPVLAKSPYLGRTIVATATAAALLSAYWGLFTWIPNYLSSPVDKGGAGLGIVKSAQWLIPVNVGAFFGYISFGFFADHFGRRPTFVGFVLGAAVLVPIYALSARSEWVLFLLGPLVGFFGQGYFSLFGAMLSELFPSAVRGSAQGFCFNTGRAFAAGAPFLIGFLADGYGIGSALTLVTVFYILGAVLVMLLPETRGKEMA